MLSSLYSTYCSSLTIRRQFHKQVTPYSEHTMCFFFVFFLRKNKRNNRFQVVHSAILGLSWLCLQRNKKKTTSYSEWRESMEQNVMREQHSWKQKKKTCHFFNNADVKILNIFLARIREHKKENNFGIAVLIYIVTPFFTIYTMNFMNSNT